MVLERYDSEPHDCTERSQLRLQSTVMAVTAQALEQRCPCVLVPGHVLVPRHVFQDSTLGNKATCGGWVGRLTSLNRIPTDLPKGSSQILLTSVQLLILCQHTSTVLYYVLCKAVFSALIIIYSRCSLTTKSLKWGGINGPVLTSHVMLKILCIMQYQIPI